jgi:hypothetical protein
MKKFLPVLALAAMLFGVQPVFAISTGVLVSGNSSVNAYPDAVLAYLMSYSDYTSDAANSTADDVPLGSLSKTYIGSNSPFDLILFDITTAGSSTRSTVSCPMFTQCHHFDLEYYNGLTSTWDALTYTDNTNSFQTVGENSWTFDLPTAWDDSSNTKTTVDGHTLYWVRIGINSNTSSASTAYAAEIALRSYNVEMSVVEELGTAMGGLVSEDFTVTGGTSNSVAGWRDMGAGVYQLALDEGLSDGNYTIAAGEIGYVDSSVSSGVLSTVQKELALTMDYAHRINVTNSSGIALAPSSVKIGSDSCTISGTSAYCAVSTSADGTSSGLADVTVSASGYDTKTQALSGQRDDRSEIQVQTTVALTASSSSSTAWGTLKLYVENENGAALTSLDESAFSVSDGSDNAIHSFSNTGSGNYELQLATGNSDNNYQVTVEKSAYVSTTFASGEISTGTISVSVALDFGYIVNVEDENGNNVSDASVLAGDQTTTCSYMGGGDYGCPVPLSETDYSYRVSKDGYMTVNDNFSSDRTGNSDAQRSANVSLELLPVSCSVPFTDTYGHWAEGYIEQLFCREVVIGRDSNSYVPNDYVTRAEFLKIALLNAGFTVDGSTGENFNDVSTGDWFYEYVSYGANEGYIEGYEDGGFHPNDSINRAEALVILMRIAGESSATVSSSWSDFTDVSSDDWFAYAVKIAADKGIVEGYDDGSFKPGNSITRAEVAAMAVRTYDSYYAL